jgi:hypothetical protein
MNIHQHYKKKKPKRNKTPIHDVSQQMDECIRYI